MDRIIKVELWEANNGSLSVLFTDFASLYDRNSFWVLIPYNVLVIVHFFNYYSLHSPELHWVLNLKVFVYRDFVKWVVIQIYIYEFFGRIGSSMVFIVVTSSLHIFITCSDWLHLHIKVFLFQYWPNDITKAIATLKTIIPTIESQNLIIPSLNIEQILWKTILPTKKLLNSITIPNKINQKLIYFQTIEIKTNLIVVITNLWISIPKYKLSPLSLLPKIQPNYPSINFIPSNSLVKIQSFPMISINLLPKST